jgi:hypothetical protein
MIPIVHGKVLITKKRAIDAVNFCNALASLPAPPAVPTAESMRDQGVTYENLVDMLLATIGQITDIRQNARLVMKGHADG